MFDILLKFLNYSPCSHQNVETSKSLSYCPDCGKLIRTNWYIIRCSCCGKKRIGLLKYGKIVPIAKFCTNCGTNEYEIEKLPHLNYFDINFAIAKQEEEKNPEEHELTQTWCEEVEVLERLRLLPNHLN